MGAQIPVCMNFIKFMINFSDLPIIPNGQEILWEPPPVDLAALQNKS
jgi:hypothetical protein